MEERVLYTGPIRLHILHHAAREPIYGLKMIEELRRQALYLKLYPLLPGLEQKTLPHVLLCTPGQAGTAHAQGDKTRLNSAVVSQSKSSRVAWRTL